MAEKRVDTLLEKLEDAVQQAGAVANSITQRRVMVTGLLERIKELRDILLNVASGDRDTLRNDFSSNCERVGRLRAILDRCLWLTVDAAADHEILHDQRTIRSCFHACEAMEGVLRDLGFAAVLREAQARQQLALFRARDAGNAAGDSVERLVLLPQSEMFILERLENSTEEMRTLQKENECLRNQCSAFERALSSERAIRAGLSSEQSQVRHLEKQAALRSEEALAQSSASQELLASSEQKCAKLEHKLARKRSWREEAEQHIAEMVVVGEDMEKESEHLRLKLSKSRFEIKCASELTASLEHSVEQEQQSAELLKTRLLVGEELDASLRQELEEERHSRLDEISGSMVLTSGAGNAEELRALQKENDWFRAELSLERSHCRKAEQQAEAAEGGARELHEMLAESRRHQREIECEIPRLRAELSDAILVRESASERTVVLEQVETDRSQAELSQLRTTWASEMDHIKSLLGSLEDSQSRLSPCSSPSITQQMPAPDSLPVWSSQKEPVAIALDPLAKTPPSQTHLPAAPLSPQQQRRPRQRR